MWPQGLYHKDYMDEMYDLFYDRATYDYKWSFWPRRCYTTGRLLFCTLALRGRAIWTGPGEPAVEDRWYDRSEGLIMMLKKVSN